MTFSITIKMRHIMTLETVMLSVVNKPLTLNVTAPFFYLNHSTQLNDALYYLLTLNITYTSQITVDVETLTKSLNYLT